jgi:hypothetical protein
MVAKENKQLSYIPRLRAPDPTAFSWMTVVTTA